MKEWRELSSHSYDERFLVHISLCVFMFQAHSHEINYDFRKIRSKAKSQLISKENGHIHWSIVGFYKWPHTQSER